jgi:ABC-type glycerol-3-phosphate transport system permease component
VPTRVGHSARLLLHTYSTLRNQQAAAVAMLLTLPVVAIAFIAQKYLVAGLSAGAVEG